MAEEQLSQEVTKHSFRQKVWDYLIKNKEVNFPLPACDGIPNFKGAFDAALSLSWMEQFKKAKTVKINLDDPQEPVRFLALEAEKEILVPIPRLKSGLFLHVTPVSGASNNKLKTLSNIHGLMKVGKPLGVDSNIKIDLVVMGSVCVSRDGYRVGTGKGFADLEFAIMMRMGAVTQDTVVITTVHDCQVVDSMPPELFKEYDVPVDIIVTPSDMIIVDPRLKKPTGILWHMLSERRLKTMPVLQQLKEMDEKDGKVITLKEEDSDAEAPKPYRSRSYYKRNKSSMIRKDGVDVNDACGEGENAEGENAEGEAAVKARFPRRRTHNKVKREGDNKSPSKEGEEKLESSDKSGQQRRRNLRQKAKSQIEFSLKLSNISPGVRIRDLKNALSERGVKANEITWQRYRGICYLHFNKLKQNSSAPEQPIQVDSIMANLRELRIGESTGKDDDFIIVEPAKPISRIEVTDVTSV